MIAGLDDERDLVDHIGLCAGQTGLLALSADSGCGVAA
jgi:hypothetical protein